MKKFTKIISLALAHGSSAMTVVRVLLLVAATKRLSSAQMFMKVMLSG